MKNPLILAITLLSFAPVAGAASRIEVSAQERLDILGRAEFWAASSDPEQVIVEAAHAYPLDQVKECRFVEPERDALGNVVRSGTGATPKFDCAFQESSAAKPVERKVKYSAVPWSGEARSEVAGTLFARALGLHSDSVYPARVRCHGCPADPWGFLTTGIEASSRREAEDFEIASIEKGLGGKRVVDPSSKYGRDQGWEFVELKRGTEADALGLFISFLRHVDTKSTNQRLVCEDPGCSRPVAYISDLGAGFGEHNGYVALVKRYFLKKKKTALYDKLQLKAWSKHDVFKKTGSKGCIGNPGAPPRRGVKKVRISEEGRRFFVERLDRLYRGTLFSPKPDDSLVLKMFELARVESQGELMKDPKTGQKRLVTARDWTDVFNRKALEVRDARCGS